jgi:hypothetical protein
MVQRNIKSQRHQQFKSGVSINLAVVKKYAETK